MVAWEEQIAEAQGKAKAEWQDKYVAYAKLKRKLEHMKAPKKKKAVRSISIRCVSGSDSDADRDSLLLADLEGQREEFLEDVHEELQRVAAFYHQSTTSLEARVHRVEQSQTGVGGNAGLASHSLDSGSEQIEALHAEAVQLTEFCTLNVEALRKIVKKMDKISGSSVQKDFVERHLKKSTLAFEGIQEPFNGERARVCRRRLEAVLSPDKLNELRSKAMQAGVGVGLSQLTLKPKRFTASIILAVCVSFLSGYWELLADELQAQRCVALVVFTVAMWVLEAAPFEATALLVAPLTIILGVLESGKAPTRSDQSKLIIGSVFSDSLYLVLSGFMISSIFSSCQLDKKAGAVLHHRFGDKPFIFMLAIMLLGTGLSALVSNVTAPLLLLEVLKPLLRDLPTDTAFSRMMLLALAFSCNIGGMMTPISSPQNVAALVTLRQYGGDITWAQWLSVSIPFCIVADIIAWMLLLVLHRFDRSDVEKERDAGRNGVVELSAVVVEKVPMSVNKVCALVGAVGTLFAFACAPVSELFGGTSMTAMFSVAVALGTGAITRQMFNNYSWHLLFLIGGGGALGLAVRDSGLLGILTSAAQECLSSDPFLLVAELVLVVVAATTFVSHTVAALVLMPIVVELSQAHGVASLAVMVCALACSAACALPMTSFPNVNSLLAEDDHGRQWLAVKHYLVAGTPTTLLIVGLLVTFGYWLATCALGS